MPLKDYFFSQGKNSDLNEDKTSRRNFLRKTGFILGGTFILNLIPSVGNTKERISKKRSKSMSANDEFLTLARTIYGECKSEPLTGQYAVGYTVKNRAELGRRYFEKNKVRHPQYGDGSIISACLSPGQFSCWNEYNYVNGRRARQNPTFNKLISLNVADTHEPLWAECLAVAKKVLHTDKHNPIENCTHFIPRDLHPLPNWALKRNPSFSIGNHVFYKVEKV